MRNHLEVWLAIGRLEVSFQSGAIHLKFFSRDKPFLSTTAISKERLVKIVNHVNYVGGAAKVASVRPAHRAFMSKLGEQGRLVAAGPLCDGSGAIFIYEADDLDAAEAIFAEYPYRLAGVVASHTMQAWEIVSVYPNLFRP